MVKSQTGQSICNLRNVVRAFFKQIYLYKEGIDDEHQWNSNTISKLRRGWNL